MEDECSDDEDEYESVYYNTTNERTGDKDSDTEKTPVKTVTGSSRRTKLFSKLMGIGFITVTIPCFIATFLMILQLKQEIAELQSKETSLLQAGRVLTRTAPQSPLTLAQSVDSRSEDEKISAAMEQLKEADGLINDNLEQMTKDFSKLQSQVQTAFSQASKKIENGGCRLDRLLDKWAIPTDSIGALLTTEGWEKVADGLYFKHFSGKSEDRRSYADSKIECAKRGGRLAAKAMRYIGEKGKNLKYSWIGYDDIETERMWVWSDGTKTLYPGKVEWYQDQPDSMEGDEDCAIIGDVVNGKILISDAVCAGVRFYLCEIEAPRPNKDCDQ